jgi:glutathione S-transferase
MPTGIHQLGDVTPCIEQLQSNLTRITVAIVELDKRNKRLEQHVRVLERRLAQQKVTKAQRAPQRRREKRLSIADIAMLTMPSVQNHQRY